MLDQIQFPKHTGNHTVAYFGYALLYIFNCHARKQDARILDLHPVIIDSNSQWRTYLRIISMHNGIDNRFTHNGQGNTPHIAAVDLRKVCPPHSVFFNEFNYTFNGNRQVLVNLYVIKNDAFSCAGKTPTLDPGIRKTLFAFNPKQQYPADGWNQPSLYLLEQFQGEQLFFTQLTLVFKQRFCRRYVQ